VKLRSWANQIGMAVKDVANLEIACGCVAKTHQPVPLRNNHG